MGGKNGDVSPKRSLTGPSFCRLASWSYIVRRVKWPLEIASMRASWSLPSGATSAMRSTNLFLDVFFFFFEFLSSPGKKGGNFFF